MNPPPVYSVDWLRSLPQATIRGATAARVLGVDRRTVARMVDRRELIGRRTERILFVTVESLIAFLDGDR